MMCYDIIESESRGKVSEETNEDALVITEDYIAVIDGSTSKGTLPYPRRSGRMAREMLSEAIRNMRPGMSISEAAAYLTSPIHEYYEKNGILEIVRRNTEERITASIVIYSASRNEIWQIGDCPCLIDGELHDNQKYWEHPLASVRSLYLERELASGKGVDELRSNDTGRDFIIDLLRFSTRYQNDPDSQYGYAVIDGFDIPEKYLICIPLGDEHEIVLASDGYICLKESLEESERYNARQKENDPLCMHEYKMTKGLGCGADNFDDRTYVRFKVHKPNKE